MGRSPCCVKVGLKKGPWSPEEDRKLTAYIQQNGHGNWSALPAKAGLRRCGKSCRLRWINYLRTDIKRGKFSLEEDRTIIQLHALLGNKWSIIAAHLPKRTDNEIKNYWNTHLKKRLTKMGIDPMTHKPKFDQILPSALPQCQDAAYLSHMAQWETARLQAEARLVRESKFQLAPNHLSSCSKPAPFVLKKNPAQPPLPPSSWSWSPSLLPSKPDNNVNMHNMYAVLLATNDFDSSKYGHANQNLLPSPNNANSLDFTKTSASRQADYVKDAEESIGEKVMEENGLLQDDDIMVALEALRASPYNNTNNISVGASNSVFEGLCVPAHDSSYEKIEAGKGSDNESSCNRSFEDNLDYWNNLLNLGE